jgi:hypothetical protein
MIRILIAVVLNSGRILIQCKCVGHVTYEGVRSYFCAVKATFTFESAGKKSIGYQGNKK